MPPIADKRDYLRRGAGIGAFAGFVIAFAVQSLAPVLAKVPGFVICHGGALELVIRRRTSYGTCAGETAPVHYATILIVSTVVWSLICMPLAIGVMRWMQRRAQAQ